MSKISTAPGKLIISGEHASVYGEPALIGAVGIYCESEVEKDGEDVRVVFDNFDETKEFKIDELRSTYRDAIDAWSLFNEKGDRTELLKFQQDKHIVVKCGLGMVYEELGMCGGVEVKIHSEIPVGSGMGSSASVSTSIVGGLGEEFGSDWSKDELNERVFSLERVVHGNPSGGDNTAVVYGGLMRFQKKDGKPVFENIRVVNEMMVGIVNTGKPVETTGEMVAMVALKKRMDLIEKIGEVSNEVMKRGISKNLIKENHKLLNELGVVSERTSKFIDDVEGLGGAGKICGAGGKKEGSGIVMISLDDEDGIKYLVDKYDFTYDKVRVGVDGWQIK